VLGRDRGRRHAERAADRLGARAERHALLGGAVEHRPGRRRLERADARGRREQAALELFAERAYDRTTVDDIATRAGVTTRTFFRHFPDRREVLFAVGDAVAQVVVAWRAGAPGDAAPLDAAGARPRRGRRARCASAASPSPAASVTAEAAVAVFRAACDRRAADDPPRRSPRSSARGSARSAR